MDWWVGWGAENSLEPLSPRSTRNARRHLQGGIPQRTFAAEGTRLKEEWMLRMGGPRSEICKKVASETSREERVSLRGNISTWG